MTLGRDIGRNLWRVFSPAAWLWEFSLVSWALLASYFLYGRHGHLDWLGHALGRDFINAWTAGHLIWTGQIADIFDPHRFLGHERALFDRRLPFHFWSYPPPNLFLVAPLGFTGYFTGFALWSAAGVAALVPTARLWAREHWLRVLLVLSPAVPTDIGLGQNGAFTAALLISGLCLMDTRPALAGALLGLLIFKPQIAVVLPVMVLAGRRWRTMGAAATVAAAVLLLSWLVFGTVAWKGFFGPTLTTQAVMLKQGRGPFEWMMPSAYMAARCLKLTARQAALVQIPFSLAAMAAVAFEWVRKDRPLELRAAVTMVAPFVASPQAFNYDLIPVCAAALVLWRRDPIPWLGVGLALLAWATPVLMLALTDPLTWKGMEWARIPFAPVVLAALMVRLTTLRASPGERGQPPTRAASRSIAAHSASNT